MMMTLAALEAKIEQIDADMMKFATDSGKLNDLMKEKDANEYEPLKRRWIAGCISMIWQSGLKLRNREENK